MTSMVKKIIKGSYFFNLLSPYFGYRRCFSRKELFEKKRVPRAKSSDFKVLANTFEELAGKDSPNLSSSQSIFGWIPFIKGHTKIIFWNFYSYIYSIRRTFVVRISIINKNKLLHQKLFTLGVHQIIEFEVENYFDCTNCTAVSLEFFHPYIKKNHGGHDGQLRFWGKYFNNGFYCATVHSTPLSFETKHLKSSIASRIMVPEFSDESLGVDLVNGITNCNAENSIKRMPGYTVFRKDCQIDGVWHLTNDSEKSSTKRERCEYIYRPQINALDIEIYMMPHDIGITSNSIEITLYDALGNIACSRSVSFPETGIKNKLSNYFDNFFEINPSIIKLNYENSILEYISYAFIRYNKTLDGIHTLLPPDKGNCLKFLHFPRQTKEVYSIISFLNAEVNNSTYKVKVILDNGNEHISNLICDVLPQVISHKIMDLFPQLSDENYQNGICILQSLDRNYNGNLLTVTDCEQFQIAIDHLTGA